MLSKHSIGIKRCFVECFAPGSVQGTKQRQAPQDIVVLRISSTWISVCLPLLCDDRLQRYPRKAAFRKFADWLAMLLKKAVLCTM